MNPVIRDAHESDLPQLDALARMGAVHADRVRGRDESFRYFVCELNDRVIGFGMLTFTAPSGWERPQHMPLMTHLFIIPPQRGRGFGSAMIAAMERAAVERGLACMYVSVEPRKNPRAFALYQQLGYQPLQTEPFVEPYRFVDSSGQVHQGVEELIEMRKWLA